MINDCSFELRSAKNSDLAFAEEMYIETMEPLLTALGDWNEDQFRQRITRQLRVEESQIIMVDGRDIGFMQVIETDTDINLAQLHLQKGYRRNGIGTRLVSDLLARAARGNKTASLSAPRNNAAIALYKRLGYAVSRDDGSSIIDMLNPTPAQHLSHP